MDKGGEGEEVQLRDLPQTRELGLANMTHELFQEVGCGQQGRGGEESANLCSSQAGRGPRLSMLPAGWRLVGAAALEPPLLNEPVLRTTAPCRCVSWRGVTSATRCRGWA